MKLLVLISASVAVMTTGSVAQETRLVEACRIALSGSSIEQSASQVHRHVEITASRAEDGTLFHFNCYFRNLDDSVPELAGLVVRSGGQDTQFDALTLESLNKLIWDHFGGL